MVSILSVTSESSSSSKHVWFALSPADKLKLYRLICMSGANCAEQLCDGSQDATAGVKTSQVVYVADICRFSGSYVTAVAAGARGIVRFGTRMSRKEFQARGRSSADTRGRRDAALHVCEDESSGRLTFALVSISEFFAPLRRCQPRATCCRPYCQRSRPPGNANMTQRSSVSISIFL